jgi:hypothetical protein
MPVPESASVQPPQRPLALVYPDLQLASAIVSPGANTSSRTTDDGDRGCNGAVASVAAHAESALVVSAMSRRRERVLVIGSSR